MREREAKTKSVKEQAEKLRQDLEVREDDIRSAKRQIDKLAKGLEEGDGRTLIATALTASKLEKIETLEASQTPPNQPKETSEEEKWKPWNLIANHEVLRKALEEVERLASTTSAEIDDLKAAREED